VTDTPESAEPDRPAGWSERQIRTLTEIFATFVEPAYAGESRRHAELAATALSTVADPADLRQVQLTLSLLSSRAGSLVLAQRSAAFGRLSGPQREALLHGWSTSRLPQRRTFFQLVKRLACFFAYADPGPSGSNARWADIGYELADEPVADGRSIERAIVAVDRTIGAARLELVADVVVVGSGAGGGVVAARLAEAGRDVLVVEAGPYVPESELPDNELDAFDRLYLDHGLATTTDLGISILAGAAVGGGTLINWTTSIEPPEWVRAEWAREHGLDGFDGAETDGHLARLRDELGFVAPPNMPAKDRLIIDGAAALGWEAAPTQRNAVDCGDCGSCGFGCRRGAKRSGQRLHLAMAAANGARLVAGAQVDRVDIRQGVAAGVSGQLVEVGRPSREFRVRARTVVVAAGALRTPALLLRSGLAHAQLGRNLHLHPSTVIGARMPGRVDMWRGTTQAARSVELLRNGVLIESAPAHPGLIALAFPWRGPTELAELMADVGHYAPLVGIVRDRDGGQVRVSRGGRTRIEYRISRSDAATTRQALLAMARLARAAGAERLIALGTPAAWYDVPVPATGTESGWVDYLDRLAAFDFAPNRGALFSAHQMSSARAGANPRTSATDPWGRVRSDARGGLIRGLHVADASLCPTAVGVNPMVTIMAMASRVANAIAA
jgi:choline dehydrogenase-like flavoprotein